MPTKLRFAFLFVGLLAGCGTGKSDHAVAVTPVSQNHPAFGSPEAGAGPDAGQVSSSLHRDSPNTDWYYISLSKCANTLVYLDAGLGGSTLITGKGGSSTTYLILHDAVATCADVGERCECRCPAGYDIVAQVNLPIGALSATSTSGQGVNSLSCERIELNP